MPIQVRRNGHSEAISTEKAVYSRMKGNKSNEELLITHFVDLYCFIQE